MESLEKYYHWFFLLPDAANCKLGKWNENLRVAPVKKTTIYNQIWVDIEHVAFAEKNIKWDVEYFHWLKEFLWINCKSTSPIFICDNHNHALSFRYQCAYNHKLIWKNITLIHIDQHSDCRENNYEININWWHNSVFNFVNNNCHVWNFIPPAIKSWLISKQIQIRSSDSLKHLELDNNIDFILDIDLDFCLSGIDRSKIDNELVIELKKIFNELSSRALCISIATSPYFLDQITAIKLIEYLLN